MMTTMAPISVMIPTAHLHAGGHHQESGQPLAPRDDRPAVFVDADGAMRAGVIRADPVGSREVAGVEPNGAEPGTVLVTFRVV